MTYISLTTPQKAELVAKYLKQDYPEVRTPLVHRNAFELVIAAMLSPQTTDEVTNKITKDLLEIYSSPEKLARAKFNDVLNIIRSTNYNKTKTERIIKASQIIVDKFDNKIPHTMDEILILPGVGRKVANVILNDWYAVSEDENLAYPGDKDPNKYNSVERGSINPSGFVVDTHVLRVSNALQLVDSRNPDKVEALLKELYKPKDWMGMGLRFVFHGREVFQAKNPQFKESKKWDEVYSELGY